MSKARTQYRVPIRVFVSHSDDDSLVKADGSRVPLRDDAAELLSTDLLVRPEIVPIHRKRGDITRKIIELIQKSHYFLSILTKSSVGRPWVTFEFGVATQALASQDDSVSLDFEKRLYRFFVLEPDVKWTPPQFTIVQPMVRIGWEQRAVHLFEKAVPKGHRLKQVWPRGVRNEHVRAEIGEYLLHDVFNGHVKPMPANKRLKPYQYEMWLNAFAAWSRARFMAVSRQRLVYWWKGHGARYMQRLAHLADASACIQRLTIWNTARDGFPLKRDGKPTAELKRINDSRVANRVRRRAGFKYCCDIAKILDMLVGYMRDCHAPMYDAAYIFRDAVPEAPQEPHEFLKYKDTYVLQTTGVNKQTVEYVLHPDDDHVSVEFQRLFEEALAGSLHADDVLLTKKLTVRGAGSMQALVENIREYHDSAGICPTPHGYRLPPAVRGRWSRLVKRGPS